MDPEAPLLPSASAAERKVLAGAGGAAGEEERLHRTNDLLVILGALIFELSITCTVFAGITIDGDPIRIAVTVVSSVICVLCLLIGFIASRRHVPSPSSVSSDPMMDDETVRAAVNDMFKFGGDDDAGEKRHRRLFFVSEVHGLRAMFGVDGLANLNGAGSLVIDGPASVMVTTLPISRINNWIFDKRRVVYVLVSHTYWFAVIPPEGYSAEFIQGLVQRRLGVVSFE